MALQFTQMNRADSAFAAAITFLAGRDPFRTLPFGQMAETVSGAIKRKHYLFAAEGGQVVGLTCWAVTSASIAERWMTQGYIPSFEECLSGDTVVLTLGGGEHPQVALLGIRAIGLLYPGQRYWMNRFGRARRHSGRFPKPPRA